MAQRHLRTVLMNAALAPRRLAASLSRAMPGAASTATTVAALDGQWLRILQAEGAAGARRITRLLACPVQGAGMEEIVKTVRQACATEGLEPRDVLLVNPTHLCTVRLFSLPSTDAKEVRDIVDLQAEKHTPYAKEEILTDFTVIERDRAGYSRVLLVIAHQDVIHRAVGLLDALGWSLDHVGCELEGLVHWFRQLKRPPAGASQEVSLVVDVDASTTTLLVLQRLQPRFHRSLGTGIEQLEDDPQHANERFVGELQRSIEAWEAEAGTARVQEIVVTGCVERLGALALAIERGVQLPVRVVAPLEGREVSETAAAARERLPAVSFAALAGLISGLSALDLTPHTTKLRQAFEARAKALVVLGCQCVGLLVLVAMLLVGRGHKAQRYYQRLSQAYQAAGQEAVDVEETLRQTGFVKDQLRRRGQLLEAVRAMAEQSPPEVRWQVLTFTSGENIILKGSSEALPKVYEFAAGLKNAPLFASVEPRRVTKRQTDGQDVTDFELACVFATGPTTPLAQ